MEKVAKYCRELQKTYETDYNSTKATLIRKKIRKMLCELENDEDGCPRAVEIYWRAAYYEPLANLRRNGSDKKWLDIIVGMYCGEIQTILMNKTRHAAMYNLYLGDLHRYLSTDSTTNLSRMYYERALELNPDMGQPYNQLGLKETSIAALRYYLMALLCRNPFEKAWDNVLNNLKQKTEDPMITHVASLADTLFNSYSRMDLSNKITEFNEEVKSAENPFELPSLPILLEVLSLVSRLSVIKVNAEAFFQMVAFLSECFCFLLKKLKMKLDDEEEEKLLVPRGRRRVSSSGSDSESNDGDSSDEDAKKNQKPPACCWLKCIICDWIHYTAADLSDHIKEKRGPIPAVVTNNFDAAVDKLLDSLNESVSSLLAEETADEETRWLLKGASALVKDDSCGLRTLAYLTFRLTASKTTPIEFTKSYFRKTMNTKLQGAELHKKMAELHMAVERTETARTAWMPVFIVLDYTTLEKHLQLVRPLLMSTKLITVVPSFVLAKLDKMKNSGHSVREAIRLIEHGQQRDRIRVVSCDTHATCCKELVKSVRSEERGSGEETTQQTIVALLVTDIEAYQDMLIPSVAIYHIESFCERWNKGESPSCRTR